MNKLHKRIQSKLTAAVAEGRELGIQVAAYYQGKLIVDAWAGIADRRTGILVDASTLFPVFSVTKGIGAAVIHLLADQGKLDYDRRVSEIWPEFGVNGKEKCTIRHVLNHTAGIPRLPDHTSAEDFLNWDIMCREVAALSPLTHPGDHMEYHAVTYGWLVGEIAQRVDGRTFKQIMEEEICAPLGIADMYVGIPADIEARVATLEEPGCTPPTGQAEGSPSISAWLHPMHATMNRSEARRTCNPACTGIMSARAIARHYAALLPGGVDGIQLLSAERVRQAAQPLVLNGAPLSRGLGYQLGGEGSPLGERLSIFGHEGFGGSVGFADPEKGLAIGVTHNLFSPTSVIAKVIQEIRNGLG